MEPITLIFLAALAAKIVSTVKFGLSGDTASALTQVLSWVVGVGVIALAAQADIASGIDIGGTPLGVHDFPSQVLIGLSLASAASFAVDVRKAIDGTDTAREPSLRRGNTG